MPKPTLTIRLPIEDVTFLQQAATQRNLPQSQLFNLWFAPIAQNPTIEIPALLHKRLSNPQKNVKAGHAICLHLGINECETLRKVSDMSCIPRTVLAKLVIEAQKNPLNL